MSERSIRDKLYALGFCVSKTTVHRRLEHLRRESCFVTNNWQQQKRKLSNRTKRWMVRLVRFHNVRTSSGVQKELLQHGHKVSKSTVLRNLHCVKTLHLARPRRRPLLTHQHTQQRLQWARLYLGNNFDWSTALFSDEKVWYIDGPDLRPRVWQDTRDPPLILPRTGQRNQSIHIWGAFSMHYTPYLVVLPHGMDSTSYCTALETVLVTKRKTRQYVLFQDRHPVHQSAQTQKWLSDHSITTVSFPPKSADINPIENLWAQLNRIVFPGNKTYNNAAQLLIAIKEAWHQVQADKAMRTELVYSMPQRLEQVVTSKGRWTEH